MSLLFNQFKNADSNFLDEMWEKVLLQGNMTGFTAIDILTASIEKDLYRRHNRLNGGLFPQIYQIVGDSGTGKTSEAIELIGGALDNFRARYGEELGEVFFIDNEGHTPVTRWCSLTGWTEFETEKSLYLDKETFSPSAIYNLVRKIADMKDKKSKELTVETGMSTLNNRKHTVMAPTYILIDSVANLTEIEEFEHSKDGELKDDELFNNMEGFRNARGTTNLLKKMKVLLVKYNICVIFINHFTNRPIIDMKDKFTRTRSLPWLPEDKSIKGGDQMFFQTAYLLRLKYRRDHSKEANQVYGEKIHGQINTLVFIKNKNGIEGVEIPLVFDSSRGYLPELSDFEYLVDRKYGVTGSTMYNLDILPELKFYRKGLFDLCMENPVLARAIQFTAKIHMIYTYVKHQKPLDLKQLGDTMSFTDRIKLICSYTADYPRYKAMGKTLRKEHIIALAKSKLHFNNTDSNSDINEKTFEVIENAERGYTGYDWRISLQDVLLNKKKNGGKNSKYIFPEKSV